MSVPQLLTDRASPGVRHEAPVSHDGERPARWCCLARGRVPARPSSGKARETIRVCLVPHSFGARFGLLAPTSFPRWRALTTRPAHSPAVVRGELPLGPPLQPLAAGFEVRAWRQRSTRPVSVPRRQLPPTGGCACVRRLQRPPGSYLLDLSSRGCPAFEGRWRTSRQGLQLLADEQ